MAPNELDGKVAVITGGSGAIGTAIASALTAAGATAISLDVAEPANRGAAWLACDVRSDESVSHAVKAVHKQHGRLDLAIHAAGISRDAVVWKLPVDDWDLVHQVNLRGAFLLLRHSIPILRQQDSGGRVVLIGSINGSRGKFGTAAYSSSKAGLLGLAKTVARETGRFGVLINVLEPGWVRTPLTESVPPQVREAALAETLVGSFLDTSDIAAATLFLCGNGAKRITGQVFRVDGGQFLGPV